MGAASSFIRQNIGLISRIEAHLSDAGPAFPTDGLTLQSFGAAHLVGVPPGHWAVVTDALARRGVIWAGQSGGVRKVFSAKPNGVTWAREATPIDELWTKLAKHVSTIVLALRQSDQAAGNESAFAASKRFVAVCAKAIRDDGVTLADIRAGVMDGLSEKLVAVIVNIEPSLALNSKADSLEFQCFAKKSNDNEASLIERTYREIKRRGNTGANRSDLFRNVRPLPNADELSEAIDELMSNGMIAMSMQKGNGLRRAKHYFATS